MILSNQGPASREASPFSREKQVLSKWRAAGAQPYIAVDRRWTAYVDEGNQIGDIKDITGIAQPIRVTIAYLIRKQSRVAFIQI